jgi:hypothetical protein
MKRWYWYAIAGITTGGLVIIAVMLLLPKPPIPSRIKAQLTSSLLLPKDARFHIDRSSAKFEPSLKALSVKVSAFGQTIIISEQPTPEQFTDVPQAYQKVLEGMDDYSDFDTGIGSVHLTKPSQLQGGQSAVVNAKGTLLFAKPSSALSTDQWRQFFKSFEAQN